MILKETTNNRNQYIDAILSLNDKIKICEYLIEIFCQNIDANEQVLNENPIVTDIKEFIQKNYSQPELSIQYIADHLFLNYSYICYVFKNELCITINEYIQMTRMKHAQRLILSGNKNINIVAEQVGFNDAGYFSKCFRKFAGVSPTEFIKIKNI